MQQEKNEHSMVFLTTITVILCNINFSKAQSKAPEPNDVSEPHKIIRDGTKENINSSVSTVKLQEGTKLVFAEVEDAKRVLITRDAFIKYLSPFDRSARLKTDRYVSEKDFLKHIVSQIRPWTADERRRIKSVVESVAGKLSRLKLNLPQQVFLIKTTGKEEGGAAYCRSGAIVLPQNKLDGQNFSLENLIIHELFHILTSNNPKLKEALYEVIHFKKCNDIKLPDKVREIKITNPDAPKNDYYIEVQYEGRPTKLIPIIYSSAPKYDVRKGGEFFRYLVLKLLVVEKVGRDWQFKLGGDAKPILLDVQEVPDYFNKIGMNTNYIIHPEEILAENFVLMVTRWQHIRTRWVIEKMENLFQSVLVEPLKKSKGKPE